jgi:hypothetical protein
MDKDLARATVLERCACYDRALDSAKKVLKKYAVDSDESFWARKIVKSLGSQFLKQRFADRAMECYRLLLRYSPDPDQCSTEDETGLFEEMGPETITVSTTISQDVHEILATLQSMPQHQNKSEARLLREGLYLLMLKYAEDQNVRKVIFEKMKKVISKQGEENG